MSKLFLALTLAALAIAFTVGGPTPPAEVRAAERGLTFEIYKDAKEEFRWRLKAGNGKVIGTSSEGYKAKADCEKSVKSIQEGAAESKVVDSTTGK